MPFRSRRRSSRRFVRTSRRRISFKRRRHARRGGRRSLAIRDFKSVAREFLWGSISVATGTTPTPNIVTPGQSLPFAPVVGVANGWQLGINTKFKLTDMPASFVTYVREFDYFKIVNVTLKFKPRWNNVNMVNVGTSANGPTTAPRCFFHTQHDEQRIELEVPASSDDIMKYPDHTIYDLSQQRMYHLKPNTMMTTSSTAGSIASSFLTPGFRKWQSTLLNSAGSPGFTDPDYYGLQAWLEWQNPPEASPTPGENEAVIDIFATYTVQMKEHHE